MIKMYRIEKGTSVLNGNWRFPLRTRHEYGDERTLFYARQDAQKFIDEHSEHLPCYYVVEVDIDENLLAPIDEKTGYTISMGLADALEIANLVVLMTSLPA